MGKLDTDVVFNLTGEPIDGVKISGKEQVVVIQPHMKLDFLTETPLVGELQEMLDNVPMSLSLLGHVYIIMNEVLNQQLVAIGLYIAFNTLGNHVHFWRAVEGKPDEYCEMTWFEAIAVNWALTWNEMKSQQVDSENSQGGITNG